MSERKRPLTKEEIKRKRAYKKARKIIFPISRISFVVALLTSIIFWIVVRSINILPGLWMTILTVILLLLNGYIAFMALNRHASNKRKTEQSIMAVVLSVLMIMGSITIPRIKGQIEKIFNPMPSQGELNINVYVKADSDITNLKSLEGRTLGIQKKLDKESQEYAILQINREMSSPITTAECENVYDAVDKLYSGQVDAIVLNETYAEQVAQNSDYQTFPTETKVIFNCIRKVDLKYDLNKAGNITKEAFIIGVIGNDEWRLENLEYTTGFRSDVNMLLAVNPTSKEVLMITVPRDSYVPVAGVEDMMDKLTHSPLYSTGGRNGIGNWIATLNSLFGTEINYTFKVNFASVIDIIDAIGGIDVDNPYEFTADYEDWDSETQYYEKVYHVYEKGRLHLNGKEALAYCRERYGLSNGDFGRNEHQAIVLRAMIDKLTSPSTLANVNKLLEALSGKFMSNMDVNEMIALAKMQLTDLAVWNIHTYSLEGDVDFGYCYFPGMELSIVDLYPSEIEKARGYLKELVNGGHNLP